VVTGEVAEGKGEAVLPSRISFLTPCAFIETGGKPRRRLAVGHFVQPVASAQVRVCLREVFTPPPIALFPRFKGRACA
jgi:hypothetical protein